MQHEETDNKTTGMEFGGMTEEREVACEWIS
jgi:hypothetical protein